MSTKKNLKKGESSVRFQMSGKKKKEYLRKKRAEKKAIIRENLNEENNDTIIEAAVTEEANSIYSQLKEQNKKIKAYPSDKDIKFNSNHITIEIDDNYKKKKIPRCHLNDVGWNSENVNLPFPWRPDWKSLKINNAEELHERELYEFNQWKATIENIIKSNDYNENNATYEINLDFWRELWRSVERSDICLMIADARNPLLHLNYNFISFLKNIQNKSVIILLNKSDLVPKIVLNAWIKYFQDTWNDEILVICSSCTKENQNINQEKIINIILKCKIYSQFNKTVEEITGHTVSSIIKYRNELNLQKSKKAHLDNSKVISTEEDDVETSDEDEEEEENSNVIINEATIVISTIGEPNVGKSSTLNLILGTKKVSVSMHPGRTKHLQTHYLSNNILLCDCPGIVFPKLNLPFPIQVLYGCYPIAQCRDPYSVISYLAQNMDPPLQKILKLTEKNIKKEQLHLKNSYLELNNNLNKIKQNNSKFNKFKIIEDYESEEEEEDASVLDLYLRSDDLLIQYNDNYNSSDDDCNSNSSEDEDEKIWSVSMICEYFADKRNWRLKKGKLDIYRAANYILRLALTGKEDVCLYFWPPPDKIPVITLNYY